MDALSGTASIFAVLSLAFQVAHIAIELKRALETISNAATEVVRLQDIVLQVHYIATATKELFECQTSLLEASHYVSQTYFTLAFCEREMGALRNALRITEKVKMGKTPVSRTWASIRLACTSDQVEKSTNRLSHALSLLNTNFLVNLTHSNLEIRSQLNILTQNLSNRAKEHYIQDVTLNSISHQQMVSTGSSTSVSSLRLAAPLRVTWSVTEGPKSQHIKRSGRKQKYSLLLDIKILAAYMVKIELSSSIHYKFSLPLNIAVRNIVPNNAEILEACKSGDSDRVKCILKSKLCRPNDMTYDNVTPLKVAIMAGHEEIVQLLLGEGADSNAPCSELQCSPLQIAIACNMINMARILKRYGADASYCSAGAWSMLHFFFDEDKEKHTADFASALGDDLSFDEIKDVEGWTALHRCAAFGRAEDVYLLHRLGASISPDRYLTNCGGNPIHIAARMDNVSTLEALVHLAMSASIAQQSKQLGTGIVNFVDSNGWSPLHLAVHHRATASARWLLHHNADPNMKTYRNADWFPEGYEGEVFEAVDLARMSGEKYLARFLNMLEEVTKL